jgi:transcriptional regulator with XRE-family HTH domain
MSSSVGQRLRQARLDRGLDFEAVVARTKISEKYLRGIESDDRSCFPSGFFYKSFVSQYAQALSVDIREIDAEINQVLNADAPPLPGKHDGIVKHVEPLISSPGLIRARMVASLTVLVIALAACSGLYVWWRKNQVAGSGTAMAAAKPVSAVAAVPASPKSTPERAKPTVPVAEPSPGYKVLLSLMAKEETWLSVSSDGKMVFQGILAPRDSKTVEGKEIAKLKVGNAGGLDVRLNGKLLGPLGARGQVLMVVFHPDNFEIVAPPKESD